MSIELIRAIRAGDISLVRHLIAAGAATNFRLPAESDHGSFLDMVTPLMVAVAAPNSSDEIVQLLLLHGADPYAVSAGGVSAVWYACGGGTGYPLTEENLEQLEEDHEYRKWGCGDADRLRLILDAGGDPNECADNGRSALGEACSLGDPKRVQLLLERGASPWPRPPDSNPPKDKLVRNAERLLKLTGVDSEDMVSSLWNPFFQAAESGSAECVRLILHAGFPADFRAGKENALFCAGSPDVVELLLQAGLKIAPGAYGFDPIDQALDHGRLAVAESLVKGLGLDQQATLQGRLMNSCMRMQPAAIELLLRCGASPTEPEGGLGTPLNWACWQGDGNAGRDDEDVEAVLELLIAAGADPNRSCPVRHCYPIHEAAEGDWGSPTSIRVLLRHGANVDALDAEDRTALMLAASRGEQECVELLLAAGADKSLRDRARRTALHYAEEHAKSWRSITKSAGIGKGISKLIGLGESRAEREDWDQKQLARAEMVVKLIKG